MIKHWEILENKWTQNSAYALGIQGDDNDSQIILRELSSFCSLIDAKVPNFTHIFELLNVNDDDILQRIRVKIDDIVQKNSINRKDVSLSSTPLRASGGTLDFVAENSDPLDNILGNGNSFKDSLSSSSDGQEINLNVNASLHLENTNVDVSAPQNQPQKQEEPLVVEEKQEESIEEKADKKEGTFAMFKRIFSFKRKKEEPKPAATEIKKPSGPLPIEQLVAKAEATKNNLPAEKTSKTNMNNTPKEESKTMRGVVVKGTAFPAEELGAQKIKDVSLNTKDSKSLIEKDQSENLKAQVPLDDIFAAETICQFYDDKNSSEQPKIEKIEEPTPMPTPRVITITQNRILEENLKQEKANQENKPQAPAEEKQAVPTPKAPAKPAPAQPVQKQAPKAPATPKTPAAQQPAAPAVKPQQKKVSPNIPVIPAAKIVAKESALATPKKQEAELLSPKASSIPVIKEEKTADNSVNKDLNTKENKNSIPKINLSEEEISKMKKASNQKDTSAAPKAPLAPVQEQPAQKQEVSEPQTPPDSQKAKPMPAPKVKKEQIDGFDHTIQTTSIPVYKKSNWPIEMPIVPSFTLDSMDMSSNRFAHAAAMTIVDNPGSLYNPFFVFGESGCGKTHFLNAIGSEFTKKFPLDQIFITNGVRFSRGVQRAIENGTIDKVKEFLDSAQVLIIDDIHLTAVNETNKDFISQVLNDYVAKRKQLVISSKYPPQGLSRFEELTNFQLSQGRIYELKTLRPNHFLKAYMRMILDAQVDLTEAQCRGFFGRENLTLGMIAKDIKRIKVLARRIKDSGSVPLSYEQLLNYITAISGEDATSQLESLDLSSPLSIRRGENTNWGNFGFFFPKESVDKFKWMVYATMQRAKELGIKGGFNFALKSAYSTEHIIASAFKIANVCDSKNLKAAIILGPDPRVIQPAIRDNFCDILSHMLEVMMIRCAIIPYEDIKKPSSYVKVLGDVLK